MANVLAQRLPKLVLSKDRLTLMQLAADEVQGGRVTDCGRIIVFDDGRTPIESPLVTREAFECTLPYLEL